MKWIFFLSFFPLFFVSAHEYKIPPFPPLSQEIRPSVEPLSNGDSIKRQVFLFKPSLEFGGDFDGIGISYRKYTNAHFYDLEILQRKGAVNMYEYVGQIDDDPVSIKKIGEIQLNNITFSKGISTNTPFLQLYFLGGAGASYTLATVGKVRNVYFLLTGKIGVAFKYGFIDFGLNIPIPSFKYTFMDNDFGKVEGKLFVLEASRIGLGFTF